MQQPLEHVMVLGTTEPQDFQLVTRANQGVDLTGMQSVAIDWSDTDPSGTFVVEVLAPATAGKVRVTGTGPGGLAVGEYPFRFKITDASGKFGYVPNKSGRCVWKVVAV